MGRTAVAKNTLRCGERFFTDYLGDKAADHSRCASLSAGKVHQGVDSVEVVEKPHFVLLANARDRAEAEASGLTRGIVGVFVLKRCA